MALNSYTRARAWRGGGASDRRGRRQKAGATEDAEGYRAPERPTAGGTKCSLPEPPNKFESLSEKHLKTDL